LGRLFGVQIVVNPFFLLTLAAFAMLDLLPQALLLFAAVLIHELAHVVVARGMNMAGESVESPPFGGVARLEDFLDFDPEAERSVALALAWEMSEMPAATRRVRIAVRSFLSARSRRTSPNCRSTSAVAAA